jgi:hypothetical protein
LNLQYNANDGNKYKALSIARTVKVVGNKTVRTIDNPLNSWVRSIDDGKFYPTMRKDKGTRLFQRST